MEAHPLGFGRGEKRPAKQRERRAAQRAQDVIDEVRLIGVKLDGAMALAGHAMQGIVELDDHRKALAKDDVGRNLLLAEFEDTCIQQVKSIQRSLYDSWGL